MDFLTSDECRPYLIGAFLLGLCLAFWLAGKVYHTPSDGEGDHKKRGGQ